MIPEEEAGGGETSSESLVKSMEEAISQRSTSDQQKPANAGPPVGWHVMFESDKGPKQS